MQQVAVVTGGARGIGLALARACAGHGMSVVLCDVAEEALAVAVGALEDEGATVLGVAADVRDPAGMTGLRDAAFARFGRADVVSLNAGVALRRDIADMSEEDWDWILDINLRGVIRGVTAFLPALEEQGSGHIQATASFHGHVGDPEFAGYCVSKWGIVALMETLCRELRLKASPVKVSVLCPGSTVTDLMHNALERFEDDGGDPDRGDVERSEALHADLQRGLSPDEVARIALDGIRDGRFFIFTHPRQVSGLLRKRFEALAADGSLAPLPWSS
jgi:NAD(P)-dependent dehydrogenase (short-subunit alcohol dehydrogenase family)